MDKVYVVYWTQSGNTQEMPEAAKASCEELGKKLAAI